MSDNYSGQFGSRAGCRTAWEQDQGTYAGDIMAYYDIAFVPNPDPDGFHHAGPQIYFFDPSGNRNEVFAGGSTYYADNPTRTWLTDQLGKGIFYYECELDDAFLSVYT